MVDLELLADVAEQRALIVKPYMGHRGERIHVVSDADGLRRAAAANPTDDPLIVQELVRGPGQDLKVVGEQVFAVRKPFNYFPGYEGVPDAGTLIADYIDGCARRIGDGGAR